MLGWKTIQVYSKFQITVINYLGILNIDLRQNRNILSSFNHSFSIDFIKYLEIFQKDRLNILLNSLKLHYLSKLYIKFLLHQCTYHTKNRSFYKVKMRHQNTKLIKSIYKLHLLKLVEECTHYMNLNLR